MSATEEQVTDATDKLVEAIDEEACKTDMYSQEDSATIYEGVAEHCVMMYQQIRSEMDQ